MSMSMPHVLGACPCLMSMITSLFHVHASCQCLISRRAACSCFMSMLNVQASCQCCYSVLHVSWTSAQHSSCSCYPVCPRHMLLSMLHFIAAFPCCMPVLHFHVHAAKAQAQSGPPRSAKAQARRPKKRMPSSGCYSVLLHLTEQTLAQVFFYREIKTRTYMKIQ
jgi:hypothetical protein